MSEMVQRTADISGEGADSIKKDVINVGFVGNPNCGKTTLFNAYTGARLKVANWPGVTVEKKGGGHALPQSQLQTCGSSGDLQSDLLFHGGDFVKTVYFVR